MENASRPNPHHPTSQLEQLERLLTPVQRALPGPPMAPSSAPPPSLRGDSSLGVGHAPFVSPASVAEMYGFTASKVEEKLPDLGLPELALPATLAGLHSHSHSHSSDTRRAEEAFRYVVRRERGALELLLRRLPPAQHTRAHASRLHAVVRVRGDHETEEARVRVERALGRWVVHDHILMVTPYDPARAEQAVMGRSRGSEDVYEQFKESIRAHAESQKELLKTELDARRAALQGVLNDKHAKAVNNQKSAHLSKFLAAQITDATDGLVKWLVEKRYNQH